MSLSLKDIAAHGHVRRWHTARVRREQTLGEHVGLVALIALDLWAHTVPISLSMAAFEAFQLLSAALLHDAPEIQFGDTPSPAKRYFFEHHNLEMDRATEEFFWIKDRGGIAPLAGLKSSLLEILRHADILEAWLFYRQEGLDAQKMAAIQAELDASTERLSPTLKAASIAMVQRYLAEVG